MNERQLMQLKKDIELAKKQKAELQARKNLILEEMQKKWGCDSIDKLKELLQEKQKQAEELEQKVSVLYNRIKEKYLDD